MFRGSDGSPTGYHFHNFFMSADEVKFRKPVFPGDTLFIHCELTRSRKTMARAACQCTVNGEVVSEGNLLFGLVSE